MHVYISATLSVRQEIKKGRSSVKYYILCLFIFIKYIYINFLSCWYDVWIYIYLHFYEKGKNYWWNWNEWGQYISAEVNAIRSIETIDEVNYMGHLCRRCSFPCRLPLDNITTLLKFSSVPNSCFRMK